MAKLKFNKQASLEASEVVLDDVQESELSTEREQATKLEQEPTNVPMETKIPTNSEPTVAELQLAKELTGTPSNEFDSTSVELLKSLCAKGIAADFGKDGYARGYRWYLYAR